MTDAQKELIDKEHLYGDFMGGEKRKQKREDERFSLAMRAVHKSLDLSDDKADDMQNVGNRTTNNSGPSLLMTAIMAGSMLFGGAGLTAAGFAAGLFDKPSKTPVAADTSASIAQPQEYRVTFFGDDGKPIKVDQKE